MRNKLAMSSSSTKRRTTTMKVIAVFVITLTAFNNWVHVVVCDNKSDSNSIVKVDGNDDDLKTPVFIKKIIQYIQTLLQSYDNRNRSENTTTVSEDSINPDEPLPGDDMQFDIEPIVNTTTDDTCPKIDWNDSFCTEEWDPYLCPYVNNQTCTYSNACKASLAGFTITGNTDSDECIPKCPRIDWDVCHDDNNSLNVQYTCKSDCYYSSECEVQEAGFDIDNDCIVF